MIKKITLLFLLFSVNAFAQDDDLLKEIDTLSITEEFAPPAFKALQVVTAQSTKLAAKGDLYFLVSHRFGDLSNGFDNFFGLDDASTKIGFIYGVSDNLSLGLGRETFMKTYDANLKYRIFSQTNKFPVEVVGYHTVSLNSELSKDDYPNLEFSHRVAYLSQLLISKRFNERFSLQLTPSYVHKNLYIPNTDEKDQILTGLSGRYKLSRRVSLNGEYFVNFAESDVYRNPFSLGVDIETGGHVFQLLLSNSQVNSDIGYLTNAAGNWEKGIIYFGFNLYRVF